MATDDPWGDRLLDQSNDNFVALLQRSFARFAHAPGAGFRYSNWGYAILGAVITRVSGVRCADYIRTNLLEPLGMTSSVWTNEHDHPHEPLDGAFGPMGGLWSTPADMRRWVCFLGDAFPARSGEGAYDTVLARHSRREMQSPHRWYDAALGLHYGFGVNVLHHPSHGTGCCGCACVTDLSTPLSQDTLLHTLEACPAGAATCAGLCRVKWPSLLSPLARTRR